MKWASLILLIVAFSVCFTGQTIRGQNEPTVTDKKFEVHVSVALNEDESTKNLIESHIKREIRT